MNPLQRYSGVGRYDDEEEASEVSNNQGNKRRAALGASDTRVISFEMSNMNERTEATPTQVEQPTKRNVAVFLLLLCLVLLVITMSIVSALYNQQSEYGNSRTTIIQEAPSTHAFSADNLINLGDSEISSSTPGNDVGDSQPVIQLAYDAINGHLFGYVSMSIIDQPVDGVSSRSSGDLILIEQLTSGIGLRSLPFDAGGVISQDVVRFQITDNRHLQLVVVQQHYRRSGSPGLMERSFPSAVIWSFPILMLNASHSKSVQSGVGSSSVLVNLTDFALAPVGEVHGNGVSEYISYMFGPQYHYKRDVTKSSISISSSNSSSGNPGVPAGSRANAYRAHIDRTLSYTLQSRDSSEIKRPPSSITQTLAASGATITVRSRRTLLSFDAYAAYERQHQQQQQPPSPQKASLPVSSSSGDTDGYSSFQPRPYHPMSGFNSISYMNENAGLLQPRQESFIVRHHLVMPPATITTGTGSTARSTSTANAPLISPTSVYAGVNIGPSEGRSQGSSSSSSSSSSSVEAAAAAAAAAAGGGGGGAVTTNSLSRIVYYVDAEAPAGIREALVEGIGWWDEAFQYAGYPAGTFQVHVASRPGTSSSSSSQPYTNNNNVTVYKDFDPYDYHAPRRHFVEWVNRDLRSYSLGIRVQDSRTGEILKGHVRIENLRMRQDALIAEALLGPFPSSGSSSSDSSSSGRRRASSWGAANSQEQEQNVDGRASPSSSLSFSEKLQYLCSHTSRHENSENPISAPSTDLLQSAKASIPSRVHEGVVAAIKSISSNSQEQAALGAILQRVRQLGAHEVGHTLGLAHNFAGSTSNGQFIGGGGSFGRYASVMDYPPPIVAIDSTGTKLVLNEQSYANGIGAFDKVAIDYGYSVLASESSSSGSSSSSGTATTEDAMTSESTRNQQRAELDDLLQQAHASLGYVFLTDQDAGLTGSSDWRATRWDSDSSPIDALAHALQVRALALQRLSDSVSLYGTSIDSNQSSTVSSSLDEFTPLSKLQELFPLVYLWHRYEVAATAKMLGGALFQYAWRRDATLEGEHDLYGNNKGVEKQLKPVSGVLQWAAMRTLTEALNPATLTIPTELLDSLLPIAFGYVTELGGKEDLMPSRTGSGSFDELASMEIGADIVISAALSANRLERLITQSQRNASLPSLLDLLHHFTSTFFALSSAVGDTGGLQEARCGTDSSQSTWGVGACAAMNNNNSSSSSNSSSGSHYFTSAFVSNRLALMTVQSVLIDEYLQIVNQQQSLQHSNQVVGQVRYHLDEVVAPALDSLMAYASQVCGNSTEVERLFSFTTASTCSSSSSSSDCMMVAMEWRAHSTHLRRAVTVGRPFMSRFSAPAGPPI